MGQKNCEHLTRMLSINEFIPIPARFDKHKVRIYGLARAVIWAVQNNAVDSGSREVLFNKLEHILALLSENSNVHGFRRHPLDMGCLEILFGQEANLVGGLIRYRMCGISFWLDPQRDNIVTFRVWDKYKYLSI